MHNVLTIDSLLSFTAPVRPFSHPVSLDILFSPSLSLRLSLFDVFVATCLITLLCILFVSHCLATDFRQTREYKKRRKVKNRFRSRSKNSWYQASRYLPFGLILPLVLGCRIRDHRGFASFHSFHILLNSFASLRYSFFTSKASTTDPPSSTPFLSPISLRRESSNP